MQSHTLIKLQFEFSILNLLSYNYHHKTMRKFRAALRPLHRITNSNTNFKSRNIIHHSNLQNVFALQVRNISCSRTNFDSTSDRVNKAMKSGFGPDPDTVSYLRDPNSSREVYLIGTAHVSQQSADDVKELIELVKPSCVMVELCPARADKIRKQDNESADFFSTVSKAMSQNKGDILGKLLQNKIIFSN